jgi:hypothetical protein
MTQDQDMNYKQLNEYLVVMASTISNMRDKNIKPNKAFFDNLFKDLKKLIPVDKNNVNR